MESNTTGLPKFGPAPPPNKRDQKSARCHARKACGTRRPPLQQFSCCASFLQIQDAFYLSS
eukprot:3640987-Amphidinium_carterae.1